MGMNERATYTQYSRTTNEIVAIELGIVDVKFGAGFFFSSSILYHLKPYILRHIPFVVKLLITL